jgi:hypothetical protein
MSSFFRKIQCMYLIYSVLHIPLIHTVFVELVVVLPLFVVDLVLLIVVLLSDDD